MVFQVPQYWDVAVDGIQIVLCLIILGFLFRIRRKKRPTAADPAAHEPGQRFNEQVFVQTLKQQIDQALANITEAVADEQRNLDKFLTRVGRANSAIGFSQHQARLHQPAGVKISAIAGDLSSIDQFHEQIQNMADQGMSARQISEELKTPQGEVELVLSLRTNVAK